uniref:ATP-dependent DNA helicase n=1 Tax=Eptatretus burgeri TaxID=7764 RepID=A0A8C4NE54_EPTBU
MAFRSVRALAFLSLNQFISNLAFPALSSTKHDTMRGELEAHIAQTECLLNDEQHVVVDKVMTSVEHGHGWMIAVDASGGTGKTFTLSHILNKVRAKGKVALATAASGIAATLLPKGVTFHSRTKCPLILTDESTCNISVHDTTAALIRMTNIMVVDEVSMMDGRALEAADRTFQWLQGSEEPFGGITMVFSGDWRQILTIVPHSSRIDIVGRCFKSSYLWRKVQIFRLTVNMRIMQGAGEEQDESDFAKFLLDLGEGKIPVNPEKGEFAIELREPLILPGEKLQDIVTWVYEDLHNNITNPKWLCERVILCPTNSEVDQVNFYMTTIFPGEEHVCCRVNTAESECDHLYPTEFLNTLCPSGMPPHRITLKVGMVIMLP